MIATIASFFIGLGLAASAGFRVFVPLLVLSIASHFKVIPLGESWSWVGSMPAMVAFGVATLMEVLAFYIPWFDNILDTIALPAAAVAGTAVMASTAVDIDPLLQWALAIIAGGGTAATVKGSGATTRLASTATTGGLANPILASAETASAAGLSILSVYLWPLAAIIVICLLVFIFFFIKKIKSFIRKKRTA